MHIAMQAIRNGECDQAVVAGVNFISNPLETSSFSQLGVLNPNGISKSFDHGANGYARGDVGEPVIHIHLKPKKRKGFLGQNVENIHV